VSGSSRLLVGGALIAVLVAVVLRLPAPDGAGAAAAVPATSVPARAPSAIGAGNLTSVAIAVVARFAPPGGAREAVSFDATLVPVGAWAAVSLASPGVGTRAVLRLAGLAPHRRYGASVHAGRCGSTPSAAGERFRIRTAGGPGPENEIRLRDRTRPDASWFESDGSGALTLTADSPGLGADRLPGSVVLSTGPGGAGGAAPVACISLAGAS
jgi:superoxide dismutase, Cu-Zn family